MSDIYSQGGWWEVEGPNGNRWTFDREDFEPAYIEDALWAWSRLLDYVKAHPEDAEMLEGFDK